MTSTGKGERMKENERKGSERKDTRRFYRKVKTGKEREKRNVETERERNKNSEI